ncbi:MAG TPA: YtcA family lipoprotein [Alloacidobacterium sp.]|nr:YtcA family lipoprotein [Alloacidobacterium sp.]
MLALQKQLIGTVAVMSLIFLSGCGRAPSFNILGSFFPAWLACIAVGIALAAVAYWLFARLHIDKYITPTILVYPCIAAFFAFTIWLIFFS